MCDEDIPEQLRGYDVMEREVVYLLTDLDRFPPIWSVDDLARELDTTDPMAVLRPLTRAGLIHSSKEDFVFATHAAWRMVQMVGHVV
jgi:hypothetical protein